ncbi:MAG: glutamine-hydrolyzing GMP synthase [bacterium]|jgi:GMP synthase (glutamine-hydrolysing)|nr:glutamine-hydrolyzing GMP synthase [candidate division KSB1 bacterium]MDH7559061.1 glutamine-hydrolyzing GMP synthase [bacterium]
MAGEEFVLVLDFGSQYTQLIARRIREVGVYSRIVRYDVPAEEVQRMAPQGLVLSGGPASVFAPGAPHPDPGIFSLGIPILGICYGLQVTAHLLGGEVARAATREYGHAELVVDHEDELFAGLEERQRVWMSHGDQVVRLPPGFQVLAHTSDAPVAAVGDPKRRIYGLQFHPEVVHTPKGKEILWNFLHRVCGCAGGWSAGSFIEQTVASIREQVGDRRAICALSGGVDSSVAAVLTARAIGKQLTCVFVDTGLLRQGEADEVRATFSEGFPFEFRFVDASRRFLGKLRGVTDPEEKRRIIGAEFISVFEEEARRVEGVEFLVQGTLYPDVIESTSTRGPSAKIKTHHNVGGLPERMGLRLVEPLRELFKDEVRQVGRQLGLPERLLGRHPFPGPGLAVRIPGEVTPERVALLQQADKIFIDALRESGWYDQVWQAFAVLLPVRSVGVMGDERTYEAVVALRAVTSQDGMTADWARLPHELVAAVSNRIINSVRGVNRVVYDVSSKPPSTIEWE